MEHADWDLRSAVPGVLWPALPDATGTALLGLLWQLEQSQWLPPERLQALQARQLAALLAHAYATVPYYRRSWGGPPDAGRLAELPVLARAELQEHFAELKSSACPPQHGATAESRSAGSTGRHVTVLKSALGQLFWRAFALRDHLWHRRDPRGRLAAIRAGIAPGESAQWGAATGDLVATGPSAVLDIATPARAQLEWLRAQQPAYLLTYPSNAAELARVALAGGLRLPGLREVRTVSEPLTQEVRALCRAAWDVPVTDVYSADEVGYIALQCPLHEHYHIQSEGLLVELLDAAGRPCAPGEMGRVVVTSLHNYAMPLIRYELGDYAMAGAACGCGRGLPVLEAIAGRTRNMFVAPDGSRHWPALGLQTLTGIPALRQFQYVQSAPDLIECRLVVAAPLAAAEEDRIRRRVESVLPPGMRTALVYVDAIPRNPGGKFEEFLSLVA